MMCSGIVNDAHIKFLKEKDRGIQSENQCSNLRVLLLDAFSDFSLSGLSRNSQISGLITSRGNACCAVMTQSLLRYNCGRDSCGL